jgi:hypothetical protein
MRRELGLVLSLVLAAAAGAFAAADDETAEAPAKDTRHHVKVLQDPRDISNFYTSSPSSPFDVGYDAPASEDVTADPYAISSFYQQDSPTGRYPVAGFYRQNAPAGRYPISGFYTQQGSSTGRYSRYWSLSPRRRGGILGAPVRVRRAAARDLCFMAPTLLVPFAPFVNDGR